MSAEQVGGHDHVKLRRIADELHGAVVHIHVRKRHVGIVAAGLRYDLTPQFRGFQNIGLVHRQEFFLRPRASSNARSAMRRISSSV